MVREACYICENNIFPLLINMQYCINMFRFLCTYQVQKFINTVLPNP